MVALAFFQPKCVALCKEKDELRERTYPLLKRDSMKASVSTAAVAGWQRGDTNRVWKRSSYGLTSVGRCCERLYLNSAQRASPLPPPPFIWGLNLARAGGADMSSSPLSSRGWKWPSASCLPLPLQWPHFPFLRNCARTALSACHSSSPSFPLKNKRGPAGWVKLLQLLREHQAECCEQYAAWKIKKRPACPLYLHTHQWRLSGATWNGPLDSESTNIKAIIWTASRFLHGCKIIFSSLQNGNWQLLFLSPSDGPDLLEGHRADRHGANRVSGRPAGPVSAQHHHRALHGLPGHHVLHHLSPNLLQTPLRPQLGWWGASLQVRGGKKHNTQLLTAVCVL